MEEERYVEVASRFFRVSGGGGGAMAVHMHYLGSCFLCKRSISCSRDIFMYRGDAAFCSEDCRQEQMHMDDTLHAVARRHRLLLHHHTPPSPAAVQLAEEAAPMMRRRRPTIANLAARTPVSAA